MQNIKEYAVAEQYLIPRFLPVIFAVIMKANYNVIAPFYDNLSRLIYRNAIVNAQKLLVDAIPANSAILIIGGGTGWILEEISKKHPAGLQITYVDISEKMIALARPRNTGSNNVVFLNNDIQDVAINDMFDIVITPFILDNFATATLNIVFDKIDSCLVPGGLWLFSDFRVSDNRNLWQRFLLRTMYLFFKILCNIEANELPDTNSLFNKNGYKVISSKTFFKNFICSCIYVKHKSHV